MSMSRMMLRLLAAAGAGIVAAGTTTATAQCELQELTGSPAARTEPLGAAVPAKDGVVVIGAWRDSSVDGPSEGGPAYLFRCVDGAWVAESKVTAPNVARAQMLGESVSIDAGVSLIGVAQHLSGGALEESGTFDVYAVGGLDCSEGGSFDRLCEFVTGAGENGAGGTLGDSGAAVQIDIMPGSCPNMFDPKHNRALPVAIVGSRPFSVERVEVASISLRRADALWGVMGPLVQRNGAEYMKLDVATPFNGEPCNCHGLSGDGVGDLLLLFPAREAADALGLGFLTPGTSVELVLTMSLLDGTRVEGSDCIILRNTESPMNLKPRDRKRRNPPR